MNDVTPEMIRRIIDECEDGRELTDSERGLLTLLIKRFEGMSEVSLTDLPIIQRARDCLNSNPETSPLVACTLTNAELQERRETVLQQARRDVLEVRELENGYAYSFNPEANRLAELAELVDLERQCCPFMRFSLTVEPNSGPIWLELTGPPGTKEFLEINFS